MIHLIYRDAIMFRQSTVSKTLNSADSKHYRTKKYICTQSYVFSFKFIVLEFKDEMLKVQCIRFIKGKQQQGKIDECEVLKI